MQSDSIVGGDGARTRTSRVLRAVVALRATTRVETSEADMVMEAIVTSSRGGVSDGNGEHAFQAVHAGTFSGKS